MDNFAVKGNNMTPHTTTIHSNVKPFPLELNMNCLKALWKHNKLFIIRNACWVRTFTSNALCKTRAALCVNKECTDNLACVQ